jgi:hypothetical protein
MDSPAGLSINSSGQLIVGTETTVRLFTLDQNGCPVFVRDLRSGFLGIVALKWYQDRILVAETVGRRLVMFNPTDNTTYFDLTTHVGTASPAGDPPRAITIDGSGRIVVAYEDGVWSVPNRFRGFQVFDYDPQQNVISTAGAVWIDFSDAHGNFGSADSIAFNSETGLLLVPYAYENPIPNPNPNPNAKVVAYETIGLAPVVPPQEFHTGIPYTAGMDVDTAGDLILISDYYSNRVRAYSYEGTAEFLIPELSDTNLSFNQPQNIAVDANRRLFVADKLNHRIVVLQLNALNQPPDCSEAYADPAVLWPPKHQLRSISIKNVVDPDGDVLSLGITGIVQDEPVNGLGDGDTSPDGGFSPLQLRAERSGQGNGRVYRVNFTASDPSGLSCSAQVSVCVPKNQSSQCVGDPVEFDSTQ